MTSDLSKRRRNRLKTCSVVVVVVVWLRIDKPS